MTKITDPHCQLCGRTDLEDVDPQANDGYSTCCNEPIIYDCDEDCGH